MSTKKTTKAEAEALLNSIKTMWAGKSWFKKVALDADDHGWNLNLHVDKASMDADGCKLPLETNVKICVFNRV